MTIQSSTLLAPGFSGHQESTEQPPAANNEDLQDLKPASFNCTWIGCDAIKTLVRLSDLKKHMDKHTRPYVCLNPGCIDVNFGNKAGLHCHERERHGSTKLPCPISVCRRHVKGFSRKRNLDLHIKTCHGFSTEQVVSQETRIEDVFSESLAEEYGLGMRGDIESITGGTSNIDSISLQTKLQELEKEKKELELCQARVDGDILALKRALQIVSGVSG